MSKNLTSSFIDLGLMYHSFVQKNGKSLLLKNGMHVTEFVNCSYLGFDVHPKVIQGAIDAIAQYGIHFTCSRTRLSTEAQMELERGLTDLFGAPAITFPSVTTAHFAIVSLLVKYRLLAHIQPHKVNKFIFDHQAHASMQRLKPYLKQFGEVITIKHNDIQALEYEVNKADKDKTHVIYFMDSVYSLGDLCNEDILTRYSNDKRIILYIDDAHGTSIYGAKGEGYALQVFNGKIPKNAIIAFSLAKGFGCNGGGVILPDEHAEQLVREYSCEYNFSGPLDFAIVGAANASLALHHTELLQERQNKNRENVHLFRVLMNIEKRPYHPIQKIPCKNVQMLYQLGAYLLKNKVLVSTVFYPVVPKSEPGLRIAISALHTEDEIRYLCDLLHKV